MQRSSSAEQRMQLLECLQRDSPGTRAKLAGDPACLGPLEEWVLDLIEDKLAFHVLETLLKVPPSALLLSHNVKVATFYILLGCHTAWTTADQGSLAKSD